MFRVDHENTIPLQDVWTHCIFHDFSVLCQPLFVFFWYRNIVVGYCAYFMILVFHIVHEESPFRFSLLLCWHDWRQGSLKRVKILETKYWLLGNSFIKGHFVKTRHLSFILYSTSYWINIIAKLSGSQIKSWVALSSLVVRPVPSRPASVTSAFMPIYIDFEHWCQYL